jgi:hypothetical protein
MRRAANFGHLRIRARLPADAILGTATARMT